MLDNFDLVIFDIGGTLKVSHKLEWFEDATTTLERLSQSHRLVVGDNQTSLILG